MKSTRFYFLIFLLYCGWISAQWEIFTPISSYHISTQTYLNSYDDSQVEWRCTGGYCVDDYKINNINLGFILERKIKNDWKLGMGLYWNSIGKISPIVGFGKEWKDKWGISFGVAGGYKISHETKYETSSFLPMYLVYRKIGLFRISANHDIINFGINLEI